MSLEHSPARDSDRSTPGALPLSDTDRFMREPEVKRVTGLSRVTRWRMEQRNEFPKRRRISRNGVGWLASEIQVWMAEKAAA